MLNLSNNNGSGNSYIRFAPQANAWTNRDGDEIQLKKVVMDLDSVQTGWLMIGAGVRDWQPDEVLGAKSQSPGEGYKRGFVVTLYSKELSLVDWSANAYGPCKGFEKIYNECEKAAGDNEGQAAGHRVRELNSREGWQGQHPSPELQAGVVGFASRWHER